jgi:transcriptional regulator with XRE-family HTH domain
MSTVTTFGQWPKQRRKVLGLTQRDLARRAGCAEVTLRKVEAGDLHPSAQLAAALTKCLGVGDADLPEVLDFALSAGDRHAPVLPLALPAVGPGAARLTAAAALSGGGLI